MIWLLRSFLVFPMYGWACQSASLRESENVIMSHKIASSEIPTRMWLRSKMLHGLHLVNCVKCFTRVPLTALWGKGTFFNVLVPIFSVWSVCDEFPFIKWSLYLHGLFLCYTLVKFLFWSAYALNLTDCLFGPYLGCYFIKILIPISKLAGPL